MAALIDTNVLVYRFDARFPAKQAVAAELLRKGIQDDSIRVPLQAIVEFVAAVSRGQPDGTSILEPMQAYREAEELLAQFTIVYPNEALLRLAMRGALAYQLSWFDAQIWAYAEHFGLAELVSEDFAHDRRYGSVRVVNPFVAS